MVTDQDNEVVLPEPDNSGGDHGKDSAGEDEPEPPGEEGRPDPAGEYL